MERHKYYEVRTDDKGYNKMIRHCTSPLSEPILSIDGNNAILKLSLTMKKGKRFFKEYTPIKYKKCLKLRRSDKYQNKIK